MRARTFDRLVLRRLRRALCAGEFAEVLTTGAILTALVRAEPDGAAAGHRAAVSLNTLVLTEEPPLDESIGRRIDETIQEIANETAVGTPASVAALLDRLWGTVTRTGAPRFEPRHPPLEAAIHAHLATHLSEHATLAELARGLGYSASHVSAVIKRTTGTPFVALRRRMRLERALWLLDRGASVKQAALEAGFADPAYFSRTFARAYGFPPSRRPARA